VAAAQGGCWEGTTRETLATVLSIEGSASISSGDERTFTELRSSEHPGKNKTLLTSPASWLSLSLLPNALVFLDQDSSFQIVDLSLTKDGNETGSAMRGRFAEIKLIKGRICASHVWGEALARFRVITLEGEVTTPSNALFWVEATAGKTRVTCASGWVEFQPSGAPKGIRVAPGTVGEWPSAGTNLTAAEADPRGQEDVQQAIEIEQRLRDLASRRRNELPR